MLEKSEKEVIVLHNRHLGDFSSLIVPGATTNRLCRKICRKKMKSSSFTAHNNKRALVYFRCFKTVLGGSEYLPLLIIAELQRRGYAVTLALGYESTLDPEQAAKCFQIDLDMRSITVRNIKQENSLIRKLDDQLRFYMSRQLKRLAKHADVCISTANMFDFGKPAHHIVCSIRRFGDSAFNDFILQRPHLSGFPLFKRKLRRFLADSFLRPLFGVRSIRKLLADPREHFYVPSRFVAGTMRTFYGPFNCTVFYPPTIFETTLKGVERFPLQVNYLGRISQEKCIEDIVLIVELARKLSGLDCMLKIAGHLDEMPYVKELKKNVKEKPWIQFVGAVYGKDKEQFLLSGTYAIHAERDEAFGISITEYLKAGCIPIVPDEGGTREIVGNPALTYHTNEEAAKILVRLLSDEAFRQEQLNHCKERANEFSFERYMENQHKILDKILGETA